MKNALLFSIMIVVSQSVFAQGFYLEYKMSSPTGNGMTGDMKTYYQDGNSRTEISTLAPVVGQISMVTLLLKDKPDVVYMLDDKAKEYSEVAAKEEAGIKDDDEKDYTVTVVGKEKINGYNTTHVKVKSKDNPEMEMWMSTEVADYKELSKVKSKYTGKDNMYKALEAKGAGGFPVRIKANEMRQVILIDLVKAEKRKNPAEMFSLTGYKKSESANIIPGINVQDLMKNIQNATPEERQKMMEELQKQYQPK